MSTRDRPPDGGTTYEPYLDHSIDDDQRARQRFGGASRDLAGELLAGGR